MQNDAGGEISDAAAEINDAAQSQRSVGTESNAVWKSGIILHRDGKQDAWAEALVGMVGTVMVP